MKKSVKKYLVIGGVCLFLLIVIGVVFSLYYFKLILFAPSEGECRIIAGDSGEGKVNIVFLTDGVSTNNVEEYAEFLLNSKIFSENKEKFNFYYAGEGDCELIEGIAIYCYSKELLKKSSVCPNDYIIVLADEPKKMRSSAYFNVMSININHDKNVILHEFGHVFANLADEYVPSIIPWGAKNCVKACDIFEEYEVIEGCYEGCSEEDYFRSAENSVMRSLKTGDYGKLNEELIGEEMGNY